MKLMNVVIIGCVVAVSVYFALHGRYEKRRLDELTALAPQMGMKVSGQNLAIKDGDLSRAPLFREGKDGTRVVSFAMEGNTNGLESLTGDFKYDYDDDDSRTHTNTQTFAAYQSPGHNLPVFEMEERSGRNFFTVTGNTKERLVSFDARPEFAKRFYLMSDEREQTRRVFTAGVLDVLMAIDRNQNWHIQASGPWLVFFLDDAYVKVENYQKFVDDTSHVASAFFQKCDCRAAKD